MNLTRPAYLAAYGPVYQRNQRKAAVAFDRVRRLLHLGRPMNAMQYRRHMYWYHQIDRYCRAATKAQKAEV